MRLAENGSVGNSKTWYGTLCCTVLVDLDSSYSCIDLGTSGYLNGYSSSNQGSNHFAKISVAYCARMRTALIKRFEAAERSDRRLRGAAANFSCNTDHRASILRSIDARPVGD